MTDLTRRFGTAITATVLTGLMSTTAIAQDGPYAPYEGTTLVVNFPAHPHYDAVLNVLPEFTEQTGIEVEVDQLEYLKMRERQTLELTKDEGDYDLISYVVFFEGRLRLRRPAGEPGPLLHGPQAVGPGLRRR